jgi:two-component system nitrate/nitrite response regulator NarL
VQSPSTDSQTVFFRSHGGNRWISPKSSKEEKIVKIVQDLGPAFRILIVDRDSMSGDLLANALVRESRCEAAAIQSTDLLRTLSTGEVDLLVIGAEVNSKSGNGFDLAHTVSRAYPSVSIVIILNHTTQESVINAFRSGARGVFSRQQSMTEFLDCVEHMQQGFIWAGRQETNSLLEAFKSFPAPNVVTAHDSPALTARELQVVQWAAKGKTNKAIATELGLSEHTVKNYLFRAFEKLGVSSRVELLFYLTLRGHTFSPTKSDGLDSNLS